MTSTVKIRVAIASDIPEMHRVRMSVEENRLSDPARITQASYFPYFKAGSAWAALIDGRLVGFAMLDETAKSVWALFVEPGVEGSGVGRALHDRMLDWARERGIERLTLTTSPGTRAQQFYQRRGWTETGVAENDEVRFEKAL